MFGGVYRGLLSGVPLLATQEHLVIVDRQTAVVGHKDPVARLISLARSNRDAGKKS